MLRFTMFLWLGVAHVPLSAAEPEIELWPAGMPEPKVQSDKPEEVTLGNDGIQRHTNIAKPRIVIYAAPEATRTGAAAIVVPGGGFGMLADGHEGADACKWLNQFGITGILLVHRCPTNAHTEPSLGPAQDTQRAMQLVRGQVDKWKIDPKQLGLFGYSAGGQVALVAATNDPLFPKDESVTASHKPDFLILSYPWRIYDEANKTLRADVHPEYGLPPTFIAQCADDGGSLAQGSTLLFLECLNRKVPAELHIYEKGGHGYGMRKNPAAPGPSDWAERLADWLKQHDLAKK